jgi:tryptophanyl-tRNA synthetase
MLFERIDREVAPMREKYDYLMSNPAQVEAILLKGAAKARAICTPFMQSLRQAVGLRGLGSLQTVGKGEQKSTKTDKAVASFKQYREADGKFYFKLVDAQQKMLIQSRGFTSPKEAGQAISQIKTEGEKALIALAMQLEPISPQEVIVINDVLQQIV